MAPEMRLILTSAKETFQLNTCTISTRELRTPNSSIAKLYLHYSLILMITVRTVSAKESTEMKHVSKNNGERVDTRQMNMPADDAMMYRR